MRSRLSFLLRPVLSTLGRILVVAIAVACVACGGGEESPPSTPGTNLAERADTVTLSGVLRTDSRFSTLAAGLDSTRLDSMLAGPGPYTLLAPPNSAFEGLPDGTVDILFNERTKRLRRILQHHVIPDRISSGALSKMTVITTLDGDSLRIRADSVLRVGNAQIVDGDVPAANGVIHVINEVLRPPPPESQ